MSETKQLTLFSLSDSTGQTAETLSKAAIRQFRHVEDIHYVPLPRITRQEQIDKIIKILDQSRPCLIAYTFSIPALKEYLEKQAQQHNLPVVNLLEPLIQTISAQLGVKPPRNEHGMMPELDEEYFKRIEAVEFAIKLDDGKDPKGMEKADIILVGVSRTSKTPTCMYLAQNYAMKVANNPLVYNVSPPKELFQHKDKCVGLKIRPEVLHDIRTARLQTLGLPANSSYADFEQIKIEMDYADRIIEELGCPVVDVSHKAIEETATEIMYLRFPKPLSRELK
ncbi:phosphoenolpyruvate synthase regulatory protein [bacterium (Candidatus Blackallbacteria) CG17_big_fil_post_rev_8_21_14_2_50_48_46]|uniref:Putative pyruvate, phosphate dikinase regulatory protein n=1 Tax=bacterium (Candidatus Blackallbacteria) CG17_big_fil_post_rev_8_21_14_2_50_48_46 TaxID=2014261 RepID=A0A2M7FZK3_9BACT|nr:MAG: phosphoenolpyruvate synthase regulatory protein [bacterium (Candidatus Blackallbacteria) CG18_big_fil_WC_8_21_14_2_50_49_26]PIW14842.1 MAG: phosphoenolpyruvate synthase regulatory protein [bacterium (Candidatus Blackallbacteria) CG17_big_fil_post_rev_8_21_14_2_50_48_46]PIW44409.1 MAG: phosphoenolpyruvate synthase regulatory protein [bacterium (Candidatus Blackallbacteria) CG13_big_fil_rev_8_21_14_2_50_49_14]